MMVIHHDSIWSGRTWNCDNSDIVILVKIFSVAENPICAFWIGDGKGLEKPQGSSKCTQDSTAYDDVVIANELKFSIVLMGIML
jgi:hypothetical protein